MRGLVSDRIGGGELDLHEAGPVMRAIGAEEIDWSGEGVGLTEPHLLKLTINDLMRLDATWSQQNDDHRSTELIDGRIHHTPARYGSRVWPTMKLLDAFREAVKPRSDGLWVGSHGSIARPPYDLPLPDIVLTYEPSGDGFIPAASVPLVVEVADSAAALDFFLGEKMQCYARMGIPEYWIIDVNGRIIYQMQFAAKRVYAEDQIIRFGNPILHATVPALAIQTGNL